jgi:hypothetical protein
VGSVSDTVTAFVRGVTASPVPSPTPVTVADAPTIEAPAEPYTNQGQVDLVITVPSALAGSMSCPSGRRRGWSSRSH